MIHVVIGTKAQLIKMAPILKALNEKGMAYRFISTGQHRETMSDILENFGLREPDYRLYQGKDIASIPAVALWMGKILWQTLFQRKAIFGEDRKGIVLVHGDTFSTLLGALMAKLASLKVGHVESGLRSFNLLHPFPEEITRVMTFCLADYFFCPGQWALRNVSGHRGEKIDTLGNTLADALQLALASQAGMPHTIPSRAFAVVNLHRFENIYSRAALQRVVGIVERISQSRHLLFILHKPTERKLRAFGLYQRLAELPNVEFRPRCDYFSFTKLIAAAEFVVSDGGSNQEECFYLGKPILLLRKATERPEGLAENCVLSRYDIAVVDQFVANVQSYCRPAHQQQRPPSEIIVDACAEFA
ncbi:MAG: UDP-N-acetylglucosamine 2-epimerase [Candidatus Methylumidiphilus sp.]